MIRRLSATIALVLALAGGLVTWPVAPVAGQSFATPLNNVSSVLASAHTSGSDALVVRKGDGAMFGDPSPEAPVRITVAARRTLVGGAIAPGTTTTIYLCTARTGDTLSGLTAVEGTADRTYAANDLIAVLITAGTIKEIQDAAASGGTDAVKLTGDQTIEGTKTLDGPTVKPDTEPIHFKTTPGANRRGMTWSLNTNGGHPFSSGDQTLYDDIVTWGWNVQAGNPNWKPEFPTLYDTMESCYLTPGGTILGEYNYEGTFSGWPGARRWRGLATDLANGHGNAVYWGDYHEFKSNSNQLSAFQVGASTNQGFGPFGVYEVELTGALSDYNGMGTGYTNGTGYSLIFSGGGGTGAAGTFDVVGGAVKNLSLTAPGFGYITAPSVSFANGGAGTGATARVLIGSISGTIPVNVRNVVGAYQYWLGGTSASQQQYLVGAVGSVSGELYSGYNLTESGGTFKALETGAVSGVIYSSSGGIQYIAKSGLTAGATVIPNFSLAASGSLTQVMNTTGIVHQVTLPTTQTDNIIQVWKPDTTRVFEVTKDGWIGGGSLGGGVAAPVDATRSDSGVMAAFGANGVKSLLTFAYNSEGGAETNITGSGFGPTQLKSGTNQDINLKPNGTGKVAITGKLVLPTSTDANIPNGGIAWSSDSPDVLKVRTPSGTLKTVTLAP